MASTIPDADGIFVVGNFADEQAVAPLLVARSWRFAAFVGAVLKVNYFRHQMAITSTRAPFFKKRLRPKTPDSCPLLGRFPSWENVTLAAGHGGFGITMSALTEEAIAGLIATGQASMVISPFAPHLDEDAPMS